MHQEAKELNDPVWDCTLIKTMRERKDILVNPIYEWTDADVWDYIRQEHITTNPLYERGYHRVGCIGCPLATYSMKMKEFADYPQYKKAYISAFQRMVDARAAEGKEQNGQWSDGQAVFDWWVEEGKHNIKGQMNLFEK